MINIRLLKKYNVFYMISDECGPASEEVIKKCVDSDGIKFDSSCLMRHIEATTMPRCCFCGGILEHIKNVHAVHKLLCDCATTDSDKRDLEEGVSLGAEQPLLGAAQPLLGATQLGSQLHPVILLPGDGGSRIQAKLDNPINNLYGCTKETTDFYNLWVNTEQLTFGIYCFKQNMALVYDPATGTTSNIQGVTTRIPGTPPAGTTAEVEWLDPKDKYLTGYYHKMVEKLTSIGYESGVNLHGAPYDFRRAANEQGQYFIELRNLIQDTYEKVNSC